MMAWSLACLGFVSVVAVEYDVEFFGARADILPNMGHASSNTIAFCSAIEAVSHAGGGTVFARTNGTYVTGRIELMSNVTLFIGPLATIMGSHNISDWTPRSFRTPSDACLFESECDDEPPFASGSEGVDKGVLGGLFYAVSAQNFTIKGGGKVNGAAKAFNVSPKKGVRNPLGLCRSNMFVFSMCKHVVVEDLNVEDSSAWTLNPRYSSHLRFRRLNITAPALGARGHNTDGFDPWACDDVEFTDSFYSGGDDCVAIKSGVNAPKRWFCNIPSSNILVRNVFCDGSHGLTVGSEVSGGIVNVTFDNIRITRSGPSVRIKSNCGRGSYLHNVTYKNIQAGSVDTAVWIDMQYGSGATTCTSRDVTRFSNISIKNLSAESVGTAYTIIGLRVSDDPQNPNPITGVSLENITVAKYNSIGTCHYANVDVSEVSPAFRRGVSCPSSHQSREYVQSREMWL